MRINAIHIYNHNSNQNFKMKILPSESVKDAVKTSMDLMGPVYKEENREFVREFCNSLARILKSDQAERIWTTICKGYVGMTAPSYVEEHYKNGESKRVLELDSIQKEEYKFGGGMMYAQEGGNMMRTLIEYSKTIKDVPEQELELTDDELKHYAFNSMQDILVNSIGGFFHPYCFE